MKKWLGAALVGMLLGAGVRLGAQGPSPAQIQAALRQFLTLAHTWTGVQTFAGGTSIASPVFTGQWTVNGSLCAAGQVVQGGSPTTCTATPVVTSLTAVTNTRINGTGVGLGTSPSSTYPLWIKALAGTPYMVGIQIEAPSTTNPALYLHSYLRDYTMVVRGDQGGGDADFAIQYSFPTTSTTNDARTFFRNRTSDNSIDLLIQTANTYGIATVKVNGTLNAVTAYQVNGALAISATAPTVSAGFGSTSPGTVTNNTGTLVVHVTVGTNAGGTTGTLTFPAAPTGWACELHDVTNTADLTRQTAYTTTTAAFATTVAWTTGDHLVGVCGPF